MRNPTAIEPTQPAILACGCGELLVLLGGEDEWRHEGLTSFECGACDSRITLPEHDEDRPGRQRAGYRSLSVEGLLEELGAKKAG